MDDIEAAIEIKPTDMSSLRKRKNSTTTNPSSTTSSSNTEFSSNTEHLARHQNLVRQINRATDDDDDDKELKQAIMKNQMETNKEMAKTQVRLFVFLFALVVVSYMYLSMQEDANNKSSLAKALGILLGMNKRNKLALPSSARVVASTSILKETLEKYTFPSWPWSSSSSKFLVPGTEEGREIQRLLHRTTQLKSERGVTVELYDPSDIQSFLKSEQGQECTAVNENANHSILEQYDKFGQLGFKEGQKMLWLWCAIYTGEAYGFVDLDLYEVLLGHRLIHDLSKNKIQNVVIDSGSLETEEGMATGTDPSFITSILFVPNRNSTVAKGMLKYFMAVDIEPSYGFMAAGVERMNELIQGESEAWTLLQANCGEATSLWPLATVCTSDACCDIKLPLKR